MATDGSKQAVADTRCSWCKSEPLYVRYHDEEWGVPAHDSQDLLERLILEGMQAGLSWLTILRKRAHMRDVFFGFDPDRLAAANPRDIGAWLEDPGIVRHRGKLEAMVGNARAMLELTEPFADFVWSFVDGRPLQNRWQSPGEVPATTSASAAMANALKARGFRFVGPTTCYAFMQSAGLVNDHLVCCPAHARCAALAR